MTDTELAKRVEKLERDNQRMKRGGIAFLVLLVALSTIYATRPVPQKITAHEFEVLDNSGRVRARMTMGTLLSGPAITLNDEQGKTRVGMFAPSGEPGIVIGAHNGGVLMSIDSSGRPQITLNDAQGFEESTSAASIVMYGNGKKHHVIWQAPQ